jgi:hypothetical protein
MLMRELRISTSDEAFKVVEAYYPADQISPKTQFMILECAAELKKGADHAG